MIGCVHQTRQEREQGIELLVSHALAITISAMASTDCLLSILSNTCAKHYENPTMLSRVTAKNVGDVFLRY